MQLVKKIKRSGLLAAAVAAGIVTASVANAGVTPYKTGFEATANTITQNPFGDNPNLGYTTGNLVGQSNWVDFNAGSPANANFAVVNTSSPANVLATNPNIGAQVVKSTGTKTTNGTIFADVYSTDTSYTASEIGIGTLGTKGFGGVVSATFDMSRTGITGSGNPGATGTARSTGFGIDILSANQDAVLASIFLGNAPDGSPQVRVTQAGDGGSPNTAAGYGRNDGQWGTYTIQTDFNTGTFKVFVDGAQLGGTFTMDPAYTEAGGGIGGIAFANTDDGNDAAYFDNFRVVPEPATFCMIGVGAMLMLAKRPRRNGSPA